MIRVEYDGDIFERQRVGGVSRIFAKLIETYLRNPSMGIEPVLNFSWSRNHYLDNLDIEGVRTISHDSLLDRPQLCSLLNRAASLFSSADKGDVVHLTFYNERMLASSSPNPVVMTVHDMIPETHPQLCPPKAHGEKLKLLQRCSFITCVSESTQRELKFFMRNRSTNIRVCHPGVDRVIDNFTYARDRLDQKIVFIGDRQGYKDFPTLLRALHHLKGVELRVLCVGGGPLSIDESRIIAELPSTISLVQQDLSDEELDIELRSASVFVSTSIIEGFGLPILEAMARGCPCLLSRTSVFEEVAGDAAVFFEPGSEEGLAAAILLILSDQGAHEDMAVRGWNRSLLFSWEKTAREMASVYQELV